MKKILFMLTFISIASCNDTGKKSEEKVVTKKEESQRYFTLERVAELKRKAVENGDEESFRLLVDHYGNTRFENYELLPVAIIMADKHNLDIARSTIYFSFLDIQNQGRDAKDFFKLDKVKQDFILKYLLDGAVNKNPGCLGILKELIESGLKIEKDKEAEILDLYEKTTANSG